MTAACRRRRRRDCRFRRFPDRRRRRPSRRRRWSSCAEAPTASSAPTGPARGPAVTRKGRVRATRGRCAAAAASTAMSAFTLLLAPLRRRRRRRRPPLSHPPCALAPSPHCRGCRPPPPRPGLIVRVTWDTPPHGARHVFIFVFDGGWVRGGCRAWRGCSSCCLAPFEGRRAAAPVAARQRRRAPAWAAAGGLAAAGTRT